MTWEREYPRYQLRRASFFSLNGDWYLNGEKIKIPFPPQAKLSEYRNKIEDTLIYEKKFSLNKQFLKSGERCLLHFGAVDQIAEVYLNDQFVGRHEGGYLPFTFEITDLLQEINYLQVKVIDDLSKIYPYGKQSQNPKGMWYTPVSGIWQSVWLEMVPRQYIEQIVIDVTLKSVSMSVIEGEQHSKISQHEVKGQTANLHNTVTLKDDKGKIIFEKDFSGTMITIDFQKEKLPINLWQPETPYLYGVTIKYGEDLVKSYFALRTIEMGSINGKPAILLNKKPVFLHGVLDQGYFQEGLFLPKEPSAFDEEIKGVKTLGFNTIRKHIKVEPERFYYACDKYGLLVLQDMVNNGNYNMFLDTILPNLGFGWRPDHYPWGEKRKKIFIEHSIMIMDHLHNHPSIIGYTIFNEGWGQFDADKMYQLFKHKDPSRIYDATSGWFHKKYSDFKSIHMYFIKRKLSSNKQAVLLSECGGYTRRISGHLFDEKRAYGYGEADSKEALMVRIETLYNDHVIPAIAHGLCGCIYTQLSDVETEINGLYTYDRQNCKVDKDRMRKIAQSIMLELKTITGMLWWDQQ